LDAVMFRGRLSRLNFEPKSGSAVVAHGAMTVYARRGNYQIVLDDMQPEGIGALQQAFEKLKQKLEADGVFDAAHKKEIPLLPRRIGIVTSETGAAIRDILHVLDRRFANVHVLLYPTRVQGEAAAAEIVKGIQALDAYGVDVMIVGRGGGSLEDLWSFNEEVVVRAVFQAKTPIISAVGHEIDFALTDFAADVRAPTPSAAAELVVQEREALLEKIHLLRRRLGRASRQAVERTRHRLSAASNSFAFQRPEELLRHFRQATDELRMRLEGSSLDGVEAARSRVDRATRSLSLLSPANKFVQSSERFGALRRRLAQTRAGLGERFRGDLRPLAARLNALSPLSILGRGYALTWKEPEKTLVRNAAQLAENDSVYMRFGAGSARAKIIEIEEE
jgi:exodeoxyribonuclease VII large subunit